MEFLRIFGKFATQIRAFGNSIIFLQQFHNVNFKNSDSHCKMHKFYEGTWFYTVCLQGFPWKAGTSKQ